METSITPILPPPTPERTSRGWIWLLVLAAVAGLAWWHFHAGGTAEATTAAASGTTSGRGGRGGTAPVVLAAATQGEIPVYLRNIGTVTAVYTVTLHSRIPGALDAVLYKEGQMVTKDQLLAEIDPRPYQVALDQANATLAQANANLAQAKANLVKDQAAQANAKAELDRYTLLTQDGVVSREQFDQEKATSQGSDAAVNADQAAINAAQANIQSDQSAVAAAQLNLVYCHITSPFTGRIGLRLVDPGNYVQPTDSTGLAVITQIQPITVLFNLPQDSLPVINAQLKAGGHPEVQAWDQNNTKLLAAGTLLTIDNTIDTTTDTYRLKAVFDNKDDALFPNQFVQVRLLEGNDSGLTLVPSAAIQRGPQGTYVFAVAGGKAKMKTVDVKVTEGNQAGIDSGLSPGEQVVIDGADKLEDGTAVNVASGGGRRGGAH